MKNDYHWWETPEDGNKFRTPGNSEPSEGEGGWRGVVSTIAILVGIGFVIWLLTSI